MKNAAPDHTSVPGHRPSRRQLMVGAAWAVPSVALVAAAPAFAASNSAVFGSSRLVQGGTPDSVSHTYKATISPAGSCSYTVNNGPASVTQLKMTYWLPVSNLTFTSTISSPWTVLTRDTSVANKTGANTGITYYAYSTTYTGTGDPTTTCGPTYSFVSNTVNLPQKNSTWFNPGDSYYYQFTYLLDGVSKTNPLQNPGSTKA